MSSITHITDDNFESEVIQKKGLILVDFWASWCAPCHMITPILEELSIELKDDIEIKKLNVDENQGIASSFGIRSIPTLILFKNGNFIEQFVGVQQKELR